MAHPLSRSLRNLFREIRALLVENTLDPLPIRKALGGYDGERLAHDLRAGLNVALLALPQGMAYAAIAELPIVYGIACSAIAAVVAPFFAGSRHTILGPTNATAFMIFSLSVPASLGMQKAELLPLLCLMVGAFSVLGALLKVADLLQYISRSVLVGYISGAAVLIIANQLKHILGIAPQIDAAVTADADGQAPTFLGIVGKIADHLPEGQWQTVTLSAATLGVYLLLQRRFRLLPTFAITLVLFAAVAAALRAWVPGFEGLERFEAFTLEDLQPRLPDVSRTPLFEQISFLAGIAFAVAFLASLENTVMAKSLASRTNDRPDVNQDMYAVGMSNVVAGVFAGMPASGSLTRSQLNYDSGARTRFASLFCGLICLAGTFLLAVVPLVSHVPKACLAALVVGIAASLISPRLTRICLRSTGDDAAVPLSPEGLPPPPRRVRSQRGRRSSRAGGKAGPPESGHLHRARRGGPLLRRRGPLPHPDPAHRGGREPPGDHSPAQEREAPGRHQRDGAGRPHSLHPLAGTPHHRLRGDP
jgi:SulP family sulfate permease